MVIEISIAIVAVAFVVLVVYLIKVLKTLNETLQSVNETVGQIEEDLDAISKQSVSVLKQTEQLAVDLNQKSQHLDSLFASVKGIGDGVNQVSTSMVAQAEQHRRQLGNLLAAVSFGLETWQKWKEMRRREKEMNKEDTLHVGQPK